MQGIHFLFIVDMFSVHMPYKEKYLNFARVSIRIGLSYSIKHTKQPYNVYSEKGNIQAKFPYFCARMKDHKFFNTVTTYTGFVLSIN